MCEIVAVVLTGVWHLVLDGVFGLQTVALVVPAGGWLVYIGTRIALGRDVVERWGFGTRGRRETWIAASCFGIVAVAGLAGQAVLRDRFVLDVHMLPLLALYPLWGLIQQLLVLALCAAPLHDRYSWPRAAVVFLSAVLFGAVHAPDWQLVVATAVLGGVFTTIYLRWHNLWALGVWHGWLGVPCYFWLLGRDPWVEVFG